MICSFLKKDLPYQHWEYINIETRDSLRIVPERGGIVTSWICKGKEIFYLDELRFNQPQKSIRGGMPILFPICGNIPENLAYINKIPYPLNQHGFARDLCWEITLLEDKMGVRITLHSTKKTLTIYPFKFRLLIELRLRKSTLEITSKIINYSNITMPFSFGLHPYFQISDLKNVNLLGLPKECINQKNLLKEKTSCQLNNLFKGVDFLAEPISSTCLIDSSKDLCIELKMQEPFLYNVIWTDPPRQMICLEPWTSKRNSINTGDNLLNLSPQQEKIISCEFKVS